jgi:O-acetyl-ADP-ribose deacetylase
MPRKTADGIPTSPRFVIICIVALFAMTCGILLFLWGMGIIVFKGKKGSSRGDIPEEPSQDDGTLHSVSTEEEIPPRALLPGEAPLKDVLEQSTMILGDPSEMGPMRKKISIAVGQIQDLMADVLVNTTDEWCSRGISDSGNPTASLDYAMNSKAGPGMAAELQSLSDSGCITQKGRANCRCRTGSAVVTRGHNLLCKMVVHAVGPHYSAPNREGLLREVYQKILQLVDGQGYKSVAIPAISTGAYQYPFDRAYDQALPAMQEYLADNPDTTIRHIILVVFQRTGTPYPQAAVDILKAKVEHYFPQDA